jgi:hypothetical protein
VLFDEEEAAARPVEELFFVGDDLGSNFGTS